MFATKYSPVIVDTNVILNIEIVYKLSSAFSFSLNSYSRFHIEAFNYPILYFDCQICESLLTKWVILARKLQSNTRDFELSKATHVTLNWSLFFFLIYVSEIGAQKKIFFFILIYKHPVVKNPIYQSYTSIDCHAYYFFLFLCIYKMHSDTWAIRMIFEETSDNVHPHFIKLHCLIKIS